MSRFAATIKCLNVHNDVVIDFSWKPKKFFVLSASLPVVPCFVKHNKNTYQLHESLGYIRTMPGITNFESLNRSLRPKHIEKDHRMNENSVGRPLLDGFRLDLRLRIELRPSF
jgi:hypothetical protein